MSKPQCPRCASASCRSNGSPACRERARKAAVLAYEARLAAEKAAAPKTESYDERMMRITMESKARAEAWRAAFEADPVRVAEANAFEAASARSVAQQAADFRKADYCEAETPADAHRAQRDAERAMDR